MFAVPALWSTMPKTPVGRFANLIFLLHVLPITLMTCCNVNFHTAICYTLFVGWANLWRQITILKRANETGSWSIKTVADNFCDLLSTGWLSVLKIVFNAFKCANKECLSKSVTLFKFILGEKHIVWPLTTSPSRLKSRSNLVSLERSTSLLCSKFHVIIAETDHK